MLRCGTCGAGAPEGRSEGDICSQWKNIGRYGDHLCTGRFIDLPEKSLDDVVEKIKERRNPPIPRNQALVNQDIIDALRVIAEKLEDVQKALVTLESRDA